MINEYYDEVFVINLPERTDRKKDIEEEMKSNGIRYTLWEAIKNEDGVKGLLATMKEIMLYSLAHNYNNILVFEDDATFLLPPQSYIKILLEQLPKDYHCLFLGCNLLSRPVKISENLLKLDASYCTVSVAYSREAMELIVPLFEKPIAYDIMLMKGIMQAYGKCYAPYPMLVTQKAGYSSIEKKDMDWAKLMATTYAMHTKFI